MMVEKIIEVATILMWVGLYAIAAIVVIALAGVFLWDDRKATRKVE